MSFASSSGGAPPSAPTSSSSNDDDSGGSSNGAGRWYVLADHGMTPVKRRYNDVVEAALRRGDAATAVDASLTGSAFSYRITFLSTSEAVQTNDSTGKSRTLRRYPLGDHVWQFHDNDLAAFSSSTTSASPSSLSSSHRRTPSATVPWTTYPNTELLEDEFTKHGGTSGFGGAELVTLSASREPVHIDLGRFVERNCATGTSRGIRRVTRAQAEAEGTSSVSGSGSAAAAVPSAPSASGGTRSSRSSAPSAPSAAAAAVATTPGGAASSDPDTFVWRRAFSSSDADAVRAASPCPICHESLDTLSVLTSSDSRRVVVELRGCSGHYFHRECVRPVLKKTSGSSLKCPLCSTISGTPHTGIQPAGTMVVSRLPAGSHGVRGLDANVGAIAVDYRLPSGIQGSEHPNPGARYEGTARRAYLPDDHGGREVLRLLQIAWDRRLVFTIGTSVTTGRTNCVVWNGIHHKTSVDGGAYGYPDETYLARVKDELKGHGIS